MARRFLPPHAMPLLPGHRLGLLCGGDALFDALVLAVDAACHSVHLESYIIQPVGAPVRVLEALERAARRGVRVRVVVDGVGTGELPPPWPQRLADAGVQLRVYAPVRRWGLLMPSRWRRLHRKLCVVDEALGFCGGINLLDDRVALPQLPLPAPRVDFALCCTGPLVRWMRATMEQLWWRMEAAQQARQRAFRQAWRSWQAHPPPALAEPPPWLEAWWRQAPLRVRVQDAAAALVLRDNIWHRSDIERAYLQALARARQQVLLAHAYFVPNARLQRALAAAAGRGVRVRALLQGRYEGFMQHHAARWVYRRLLRRGLDLREYTRTDLHAKVAVVDGQWATVGSSNLDPLSLLLAREANIVTNHPALVSELAAVVQRLLDHEAQPLEDAALAQRPWLKRAADHLAYQLMRLLIWASGNRY